MFVPLLFVCSTIAQTYCASVPATTPHPHFKTIGQCQAFLQDQSAAINARVEGEDVKAITFCVQLPREA
jgi:hypothetical protein